MPSSPGDFGGPKAPKQCTAYSRRSGEQCKGPAIADSPNIKCRMHGGYSTVIGAANSGFSTGRHSRFLPAQLAELYEDALSNPELLDMADHIALLEARIQEILNKATDGEPVPRWKEVAEVFADVETAMLSGDKDRFIPAMERMHLMLDAGEKWDRTWDQVQGTMEQLRKMTDTEVKRKKELHQMVPVERVIILMAAVATAVKRHVTDPEQIQGVLMELATLHGSDRAPGGELKVGPEFIHVSPESRGVKGGVSREAMRRVKNKRKAALVALETVNVYPETP